MENKEPQDKQPQNTQFTRRLIKKRTLVVDVPALKNSKLNERRIGRILACQALFSYEFQKETPIQELCQFKWDVHNKPASLAFAQRIVKGTIELISEIDEIIIPLLVNWEFDRITPVNKSILRLSIYSLLHVQDVPAVVTINEAIDLCKIFSEETDYKFINAILDKVAKTNKKNESQK
jgi:transcription antitermination protein NusB